MPSSVITTLLASTLAHSPSTNDSFVHLFEWPYESIALECEQQLAPSGFKAIQISPVNEVISNETWWARYQPVTFDKFTSRSGNEEQLKTMIERCNSVGIDVYADVVINHTADYGGEGVGTAGTEWKIKQHPMFDPSHYHSHCIIEDYGNADEVQNCQLGALPDLDTSQPYVQKQLRDYINRLSEMGIKGFRIDAAKHMHPADIDKILTGVTSWRFLEVIGNPIAGPELQPEAYQALGAVTDFNIAHQFREALSNQGDWSKLMFSAPSYSSVTFVDNHDTERHDAKQYQHGASDNLYRQAQILLLLGAPGYPKLLSGFQYDNKDAAAPDATPCSEPWRCWHREPSLVQATKLRKQYGHLDIQNWQVIDHKLVHFTREDSLWVVVNSGELQTIDVPVGWQDTVGSSTLTIKKGEEKIFAR